MKALELTHSQLIAYENGASMFMFPVKHTIEPAYMETRKRMYCATLIERFAPIQKGDKFFVQEEWMTGIQDDAFNTKLGWTHKGNLAKIQGTVEDVSVVKVKDIDFKYVEKIIDKRLDLLKRLQYFVSFYNQQMKEQGINRTYEDNDYIFLVEFKR